MYRLCGLLIPAFLFVTLGSASAVAGKKRAPQKPVQVVIETSKGSIIAELYADKTPKTVANFVAYAKADFYKGLVFHRVIPGFMIQGGGFDTHYKPRQVKAAIALEAGRGLSNKRGTLAMARTAAPNSATSQFFINLVDNDRLDSYGGGYAVFGRVIKGMDVVDAIARVPTRPRAGHQNAPVDNVIIKSVRLR